MLLRYLDGMVVKKKGCLSAELVPKPGQPESVMNDQNVNTMCTFLQENGQITYSSMI